jgi:hypothetical protein
VETKVRDKNESRGNELRTKEQQFMELIQHVHVERKEYDRDHFTAESTPVRKARQETMQGSFREYQEASEHCAVLLENRGISGERTAADWGQSTAGGHFASYSLMSVVIVVCAWHNFQEFFLSALLILPSLTNLSNFFTLRGPPTQLQTLVSFHLFQNISLLSC